MHKNSGTWISIFKRRSGGISSWTHRTKKGTGQEGQQGEEAGGRKNREGKERGKGKRERRRGGEGKK
jgi:hypothetical protein